MFESIFAVPLHFTIEFFGFLVLAGGAALVVSRPELVPGSASNRVTAALGFGALAAAQVAHGGSFAIGRADGEQFLTALQTLGLALILIAVVGGVRSPAVFATTFHQTGAGAPAGAAALVAIMSFVAAGRGGPPGMRRLSLAALLLAISSGLTALTPETAEFGVGETNGYLLASHLVKLVAIAALAAWLWTGVKTSIRTRFVASFSALLVAVVLLLSTALTGVISDNVEDEELRRLVGQLRNATNTIEDETAQEVKDTSDTLAETSIVTSCVENARAGRACSGFGGESLNDLGSSLLDEEFFEDSMDFIMFTDPGGTMLDLAGDGPLIESEKSVSLDAQRGEVGERAGKLRLRILGSQVLNDVTRAGASSAVSAEKLGAAAAILAAHELTGDGGPSETIGVLVIGKWVDETIVSEIRNNLEPTHVTILVGDEVVASSLPRRIERDEITSESADAVLETGGALTRQESIGSATFYTGRARVESEGGVPLDVTVLLASPSGLVVETRQGVTRTLFLVAMGIAIAALVLAWFSGRRITRPIQGLTDAAARVREGDLAARAEVVGQDEVGQLGETFNEMTESLLRMTDDLREAARQEHDLRARIETIIESMAEGLIAVDADRKVLAFNREAEKMLGIKADDAIGRPIGEVLKAVGPQGDPVPLPIYDLAEGSVANVSLERAKGEAVPVALTTALLRDEEGEIAGGVAVVRDMTREREIERMKSEFLSNISHELRTPLTPIKGYAEILGRKELAPEKAKQFVTGILESTDRLERIVALLVDFAAMEAGRLSPRAAPVDMAEMLAQLGEEWARRSTRHEVVVDVKARLPKAFGDARLIRRSLEEVIDNAVKFSPQGGTIRLEARGVSNGGAGRRTVLVSVSDQGIGIAPDEIPQIFSDFHQLDGSETRPYGGLGLGLAFVARIIETHGGSVEVESEPEQGTRFMISLPAATRQAGN